MKPTEEEIQEALKIMLEVLEKLEEYIFDSSYRIIYGMCNCQDSNEEHRIGQFCKAYEDADKIFVADGALQIILSR